MSGDKTAREEILHGLRIAAIVLIAILVAFAITMPPGSGGSPTRAKVSIAKRDMRSVATALEGYCIDNYTYPPSGHLNVLTTPIAYAEAKTMNDPWAATEQPFHYYAVTFPSGQRMDWLLWSAGPNGKFDLNYGNIRQFYDLENHGRWAPLTDMIYDPTNGTISFGDVVRKKD